MAKRLSCGVGFMRALSLILNILFVIVGLGLIGLGIYLKVDKDLSSVLSKLTDVSNFEGQSLGFLAFVMIGGGVFTVLIALFGCAGKQTQVHSSKRYHLHSRISMAQSMFTVCILVYPWSSDDSGARWIHSGFFVQKQTGKGLQGQLGRSIHQCLGQKQHQCLECLSQLGKVNEMLWCQWNN